jgi:predicted SAM-dependent methyltransferase
MKLHVGCGKRFLPGWKHLDVEKFPHVDYVTSATTMDGIPDNSVDMLYSCHMLEHIYRDSPSPLGQRYAHLHTVLSTMHRVMKSGAELYVAVPNFQAICQVYDAKYTSLEGLLGLLYGGARNDVDHHETIFDFNSLRTLLQDSGFEDVKEYDAHQFLPDDYDDYSKSYIPHKDPRGICMSLNVVCRKKRMHSTGFEPARS